MRTSTMEPLAGHGVHITYEMTPAGYCSACEPQHRVKRRRDSILTGSLSTGSWESACVYDPRSARLLFATPSDARLTSVAFTLERPCQPYSTPRPPNTPFCDTPNRRTLKPGLSPRSEWKLFLPPTAMGSSELLDTAGPLQAHLRRFPYVVQASQRGCEHSPARLRGL